MIYLSFQMITVQPLEVHYSPQRQEVSICAVFPLNKLKIISHAYVVSTNNVLANFV